MECDKGNKQEQRKWEGEHGAVEVGYIVKD